MPNGLSVSVSAGKPPRSFAGRMGISGSSRYGMSGDTSYGAGFFAAGGTLAGFGAPGAFGAAGAALPGAPFPGAFGASTGGAPRPKTMRSSSPVESAAVATTRKPPQTRSRTMGLTA